MEAKKEAVRLTYQNDELQEKVRFLENKFQSLAKRVNASKDDLDAVEVLAQKKSENRSTKKVIISNDGKMPNSYNFYGERSSQDSTINKPKPPKTKIVEVIDFGQEDNNNQLFSERDKVSDDML